MSDKIVYNFIYLNLNSFRWKHFNWIWYNKNKSHSTSSFNWVTLTNTHPPVPHWQYSVLSKTEVWDWDSEWVRHSHSHWLSVWHSFSNTKIKINYSMEY